MMGSGLYWSRGQARIDPPFLNVRNIVSTSVTTGFKVFGGTGFKVLLICESSLKYRLQRRRRREEAFSLTAKPVTVSNVMNLITKKRNYLGP